MREQWQVRDMVHGFLTDEKRRDRMIKLLTQALSQMKAKLLGEVEKAKDLSQVKKIIEKEFK